MTEYFEYKVLHKMKNHLMLQKFGINEGRKSYN